MYMYMYICVYNNNMERIYDLQDNGTITGFPGAEKYDGDLLTEQCDILIPAAMERALNAENAEQVCDKIPHACV